MLDLHAHGLGRRVLEGDGRVVDQHVDPAVLVLHEVPDPLDAGSVVDVELVEVDGAALLHQLGDGRHAALGATGRQVNVAL